MAPQLEHSTGGLIQFALKPSVIFSSGTLLLVILVVLHFFNRSKTLNLPGLEISGAIDARAVLTEACVKYPNAPFVVKMAGLAPHVVLPKCAINEIKGLPENTASFSKELKKIFRYTGLCIDQFLVHVVKSDLTKHVASTIDGIQDEIRYGMDQEFGPCDEWTTFELYGKLARIVALMSGRVFVGRPLSRKNEWIETSVQYTLYVIRVKNALEAWHPLLRGIVAPFTEQVRSLNRLRLRGAELLTPILEAQLAKEGHEKLRADNGDEQGTFISWMLAHMSENDRRSALALANYQMNLSFAAIHTTSQATTHVLYDLATYPEYIKPLREEIKAVLEQDGFDVDEGVRKLKKSSFQKLAKLDSFMKESQRLNPPGLISNIRLATGTFTLSSGHKIPEGTRFCIPSYHIHQTSSSLMSPDTAPLSSFDGMRYYKLRQIPGNENRYQFVTTSTESLSFGHGNHACPGRFFAGNEMKVVLIELLLHWELRFVGDEKQEGGEWRRPANVYRGLSCSPDTMAKIQLKRRKN